MRWKNRKKNFGIIDTMETQNLNDSVVVQEDTITANNTRHEDDVVGIVNGGRSRIRITLGFTVPQGVKDVFLSPFTAGYSLNNDPRGSDGQMSFHTILLTLGVLASALITFYRSGLSQIAETEHLLYAVYMILVIVQLSSAVAAIALMLTNSRKSDEMLPANETPNNFQISAFFLDFAWDNKYGIRVVFMWIFGLGSLMYSSLSIRAFAACPHEPGDISDVFGILYHVCFIIFVISQLMFVNYFTNFQFAVLTTRRRHCLTVLLAGMVSVWFFILTTMVSFSFGKTSSIPSLHFNGTGCSEHVYKSYPWIHSLLELLHPTLIGFSIMGIHLIYRLKQASLEAKCHDEAVVESRDITHDSQDADRQPNEQIITETENNEIAHNPSLPTGGYCLVLVIGTAFNVLLLIYSCLLVYYFKGNNLSDKIGIFKATYMIFLIIVLLLVFMKLKTSYRVIPSSSTSYGIEQYLYLICYSASVYYHLLVVLEGVFSLRSHTSELEYELRDKVIIALLDNIVLLPVMYLQTVFILQAAVYSRGNMRYLGLQAENVCCLVGLFNLGQWIYYSIAALPSIKFYLLKEEVFQTPSLNLVNTIVFPLVTLYFLKSWMNLRYINQRLRKEYIQSLSEDN